MLNTLLAACLIVGVSDGDTLTARCGAPGSYQQIKVRLAEIDAPEKAQPFGQVSKDSLAQLCFHQSAAIHAEKTDRYGRTVARVECSGKDASLHQVKSGMAWAYTQYLTDPAIKAGEDRARAEHMGLWADSDPTAPWAWRHSKRQSAH